MHRKHIEKVIRKYLSGKESAEGKQYFDHWYNLQEVEQSPLEALTEEEKQGIREEILRKVKGASLADSSRREPERSTFSLSGWLMVACTLGIILLGWGILSLYFQQHADSWYHASSEEIRQVSLPDGTEVTLNANSSLRFPDQWSRDSQREVWLEGEAFFSVVHTPDDLSFTVHTASMDIEVLGTEFNVNNRRQETEVVLRSGQVRLALEDGGRDEIYMQPGELVAYCSKQRQLIKKQVNPEDFICWQHQELMLANTSLAEIAYVLEDFYGAEVYFKDQDLRYAKLTATARLSLKDRNVILSAISGIYNIDIQQQGNQIIFSKAR